LSRELVNESLFDAGFRVHQVDFAADALSTIRGDVAIEALLVHLSVQPMDASRSILAER
jgi:hypothetical protein